MQMKEMKATTYSGFDDVRKKSLEKFLKKQGTKASMKAASVLQASGKQRGPSSPKGADFYPKQNQDKSIKYAAGKEGIKR